MQLSRREKLCMFAVLMFGTFVTTFATTVSTIMLSAMAADFKITDTQVQWVTSGASLASGIVIPVAAYMIKRIPNRTHYLISIALFTIGSLGAAVARSFLGLIVGRVLQAVGCGLLLPFTQVILMSMFDKKDYGTVIGFFTIGSMAAPVISPTLGGLIMDRFGWRQIFLLLMICGLLIIILGCLFVKNISSAIDTALNIKYVVVAAVGFSAFLIGIGNLSSYPLFSIRCGFLLVVGLVGITAFVILQLENEDRIFDLRIFKNKKFALSVILFVLIYLVSVGSGIILPLFTQSILKYRSTQYALYTLPGAILMAFVTVLSGRIFDKFGAVITVIAGVAFFAIGGALGVGFTAGTSLVAIGGVSALLSVGMGLMSTPLSTLGVGDLTDGDRVDGSSVLAMLRQLASSLATTTAVLCYTAVSTTTGNVFKGVRITYGYFLALTASILIIAVGHIRLLKKGEEPQNQSKE